MSKPPALAVVVSVMSLMAGAAALTASEPGAPALTAFEPGAPAPAAEPSALAPFGWLGELAGACWTGRDEAGQLTDRQCYSTQYGRFLRGTIEIFAGSATGKPSDRGDSLFAWDATKARIAYHYWASAEQFGSAEAYYEGDRLIFPPTGEGEAKSPAVRSIWERQGADGFRVLRERAEEGGWQPLMTVLYRRDAAAGAAPEGSPLGALAPLAGSCFMGTFADGKTRDFICYEWVFGGKFLRSRHRVIGGAGAYAGETLVSHDAAAGKFVFDYFNSAGGIVRGEFQAVEGGFDFPSEKVQMEGAPAELRSTWRWTERGYHAASEKLTNAAWKPFMSIDFVRTGPASGWSEED